MSKSKENTVAVPMHKDLVEQLLEGLHREAASGALCGPEEGVKDCKGSVRYAADSDDAPITNAYVARSLADDMPDTIKLTITF